MVNKNKKAGRPNLFNCKIVQVFWFEITNTENNFKILFFFFFLLVKKEAIAKKRKKQKNHGEHSIIAKKIYEINNNNKKKMNKLANSPLSYYIFYMLMHFLFSPSNRKSLAFVYMYLREREILFAQFRINFYFFFDADYFMCLRLIYL